ncbi:SDR family NAD(P)-dependent oxidoreductase [Microbacterium sp. A84]|uniref:SDR family NAD(P)-dependent oxidoreductase n=1 Tax=Microbacterium sp. A84 TaxID=3450715 RepID=UPI003F4395E3
MNDGDQRLRGRRILVTGAASGMGRAIAERFAAEGAALALLDIDASGVEKVAAQSSALAIRADLRNLGEIDEAVSAAAQHMGGLDGVVNAAGVLIARSLAETDESVWDPTLEINLRAPIQLCRAAQPHLQRAGAATIVNLASVGGMRPYRNQTAYAASKGGLIAATKVMAAELGPSIRANVLSPGAIDTPMTRELFRGNDAHRSATIERLTLRRMGTPQEIAGAALFLSSADSAFVTGVVLSVDGGISWH